MEPSYLDLDFDSGGPADVRVQSLDPRYGHLQSELGLELRELARRFGVHPQNISCEEFAPWRMQNRLAALPRRAEAARRERAPEERERLTDIGWDPRARR